MKVSFVLAFATLPLFLTGARAQSESEKQQPQPQALAHMYRGAIVCEKHPGAADILHVPADLVIRGSEVQFARPLFNLLGTRVLGSELGLGSVDDKGAVHVTSTWEVHGLTVRGDYSGTITPSGATLSGTQAWRGPDGGAGSRTCQIALVPASP